MKLVILEPLGVEKQKLMDLARASVGERMEVTCCDTRAEDVDTLVARSKDADAVVLSNIPYPREVIARCPRLRLICVAFTGVDHVDIAYCRERGITVCNCAGYSTAAVAELAFGLLLAVLRNIVPCDATVRAGGTRAGLVGRELEGKVFGVVGAGHIGLRVAAVARAFGCRVLVYNRTPRPESGFSFVGLDELLAQSDVVSLHVPLTAQTRGMIGAAQLARMKPGAVLINTARGPVVDSQALAAALQSGALAGAGVDVFEDEPPIDAHHPLFAAPHVVVTPHVAFATAESFEKRAVLVFNNIGAWLNGAPINVV